MTVWCPQASSADRFGRWGRALESYEASMEEYRQRRLETIEQARLELALFHIRCIHPRRRRREAPR